MLERPALAISLPASELAKAQLPGSIFAARDLTSAPLSGELRRAIALIEGVCAQSGFAPTFVARPEIFTHGESFAWLMRKLGGVRDHLAFSDGSTVRIIPGLRNHVFFYGLSRHEDGAGLERLERRAGELLAGLTSQINSALKFGRGRSATSPETIALTGRSRALLGEPEFYRFYFNPACNRELRRTHRRSGRPGRTREPFRKPRLCGADRGEPLRHSLLHRIGAADRAAVLSGLARNGAAPAPGRSGSDRLEDRLAAALAAFARAEIAMPHVPVDNIVFVS